MTRPTKSLWEIVSSLAPVMPGPNDLLLLAPQPGTPYVSQCSSVKVSDIASVGLVIPLDEIVYGTGTGVTSSPRIKTDGNSLLLSTPDSTAPQAIYDVGAPLVNQTMAWIPNNEANLGGFGWAVHRYPPNNGALRNDDVMQFGFNPPQSNKYVIADHAFNWTLENSFKTNGGVTQIEFYYEFVPAGGGSSIRPFSMTTNLGTNRVLPAIAADNFEMRYRDNLTAWFEMLSDDGSMGFKPTLHLIGGQHGHFLNSNADLDWFQQQGIALIAYNATVGYLFPDGNLTTARVFNTPGSTHDFSFQFGSTDFIALDWTFADSTMKIVDSLGSVKTFQAKYKSSDGTAGFSTVGALSPVTSITVKDGIIVAAS